MADQASCPNLDLAQHPTWQKPIAAVKFLAAAHAAICEKTLQPRHTYHLVDQRDVPIGISAGDVCYSANMQEIQLISRLVVEFEDKRFFSHSGIDPVGILRAVKHNIAAGRIVQGGSTITQQLVRNTLLTSDRSLTRKLLEIVLALIVERHYSKEEILLLYSQCVYLGPRVRGFQAAARLVFRRRLGELDIVSLCGLVGLLRQPGRTYPLRNKDAFERRQKLLAQLHSTRNPVDAGTNLRTANVLLNPIPVHGLGKPRWTLVTQQICRAHGVASNQIRRAGLTIDRALQAHVDHVLRSSSKEPDLKSIAAVVLSNRGANVLAEAAWAGGEECELSPSFSGHLQPGSTFKPFAIVAALEDGYLPDMTLQSAPFESSFITNADGLPWRVRNYAFQYRGEITLAAALLASDNSVFARLTEIVSRTKLESVYERFGLCERGRATPSIALGAVEGGVPLVSVAAAYSAIARNGVYVEPHFVRFIHYADGSTWWPPPSAERLVIPTYSVATQLKALLARAQPQLSSLGFAGKTGTTRKGSLVAAYNDVVSIAVWLSHKSPRSEFQTKSVSALKVLERLIAEGLLGHSKNPFAI